jgi:hypothetical protein
MQVSEDSLAMRESFALRVLSMGLPGHTHTLWGVVDLYELLSRLLRAFTQHERKTPLYCESVTVIVMQPDKREVTHHAQNNPRHSYPIVLSHIG